MSFFGSIWNGLKPSYIKAGTSMLGSLRPPSHWNGRSDSIKYVSRAGYKSVLEYVLRQETMAALQAKLHDLVFDTFHARERAAIEQNKIYRDQKQQWLIDQQKVVNQGLGEIGLVEGNGNTLDYTVTARTKYGQIVEDALLMAYEGEEVIHVSFSAQNQLQGYNKRTGLYEYKDVTEQLDTRSIFFIDLAPNVTLDSQKNLVMTTVQGRDFTRKELISGGDYKFKVTGNIVYDEPGIYPENDVRKFLNIMQHNGPIRVNHRLFKSLGVKQVIVQDYGLDKSDMLNVQPYSFSCVAIEPDEELTVTADTIEWFNTKIATSPMSSWVDILLDNEMIENAAQNMTSYGLAALLEVIPSTRI